jgi:hypothetical protein
VSAFVLCAALLKKRLNETTHHPCVKTHPYSAHASLKDQGRPEVQGHWHGGQGLGNARISGVTRNSRQIMGLLGLVELDSSTNHLQLLTNF